MPLSPLIGFRVLKKPMFLLFVPANMRWSSPVFTNRERRPAPSESLGCQCTQNACV